MQGALVLVLALVAAGVLCRVARLASETDADALQRFVVNVCVPATVLLRVPKLALAPELGILVLTPWALAAASALAVHWAARAAELPRGVQGALLLCIPLGNTSFLGFPMVEALLGADSVRYAVVYDQLGSFLILSTYGVAVAAHYAGAAPPSPREVLLRVVHFPPFVALLIALLPLPRPAALDALLARIDSALVPAALVAVGLRLRLRVPAPRAPLALGLATKLVALPALALALSRAVGSPVGPARVAVLEAGMPPMITAGALAMAAGLAPELAAALVGYGLVGSMATLPWLTRVWLGVGAGP